MRKDLKIETADLLFISLLNLGDSLDPKDAKSLDDCLYLDEKKYQKELKSMFHIEGIYDRDYDTIEQLKTCASKEEIRSWLFELYYDLRSEIKKERHPKEWANDLAAWVNEKLGFGVVARDESLRLKPIIAEPMLDPQEPRDFLIKSVAYEIHQRCKKYGVNSIKVCTGCEKFFAPFNKKSVCCSLECLKGRIDKRERPLRRRYNSQATRRKKGGIYKPESRFKCSDCATWISVKDEEGKIITAPFIRCPRCRRDQDNPHAASKKQDTKSARHK
ncbi:MAG: hypothetical protein ABSF91_10330 [Bacteroidota bacterium]|jgi:hypothetical protein